MLLGEDEADAGLSFRNLVRVDAMPVSEAGVADVIGAASLLVSEAALPQLVARARGARGHRERRGGVMDPSQVIIRPVVTEKSYVLADAASTRSGSMTIATDQSARPSSRCSTSRSSRYGRRR